MISRVLGTNLFSFSEFDLGFSDGVTLIEGYNHDDGTEEGCGKSALLNAITWILYGEIPKDAKIDDVVRSGCKSAGGTVYLTNGFGVTRTRKPNDLYLFKDLEGSEQRIKGKDLKETQEIIVQMLGMSFKTFCQSVYFAQNYPNKFVTATEEDKAKILSEIEDLSQFDRARKEVLAKLKVLEPQVTSLEKEVEHFSTTIKSLESHVDGLFQMKAKFEIDKAQDLELLGKELEETDNEYCAKVAFLEKATEAKVTMEVELTATSEAITAIQTELTTNEIGIKNLDRLKDMLRSNGNRLTLVGRELTRLTKELENLQNPASDQLCPTCGSDLSKADEATIKKHLADLAEKISSRTEEYQIITNTIIGIDQEIAGIQVPVETIQELQKDLKTLDSNRRRLEMGLGDVKRTQQEIDGLNRRLESLKKQDQHIQDRNSDQLDTQFKESRDRLQEAQYQMSIRILDKEKISTEVARLSTLKDAFKEVKSFAFKNTLLELNDKVNGYLSQLFNQDVQARFYNEGEGGEISKILCEVTIDGETRPLGLYSGGQFRRIQLSVDLALSDLISSRNKNSIDFRIFDEYYKDLSETSMENCLKLFQSLKGITLLVEHNSLFKSIVSNTVRVELENGISKIVESEHESKALEM